MEFLWWVGVVFAVLGVADLADWLHFKYGRTLRRSCSGAWRRFRLWRLDRRVTVLTKRYGYKRREPSVSFGSLKWTRTRREEFLKVKDVHGEDANARRHCR